MVREGKRKRRHNDEKYRLYENSKTKKYRENRTLEQKLKSSQYYKNYQQINKEKIKIKSDIWRSENKTIIVHKQNEYNKRRKKRKYKF